MPYSDTKARKVRSRRWTQADAQRWKAQQRRELKDDKDAELTKERELAKMKANGTLDIYLETERLKKLAEDEQTNQMVIERQERRLDIQLEQTANARLSVGGLYTELASAIALRERYGQPEGDWLEDPVDAITEGTGFGEDQRIKKGVKLQVHLCLDTSNSMVHNDLAENAMTVISDMYLGLRGAAEQLPPGSLVVELWEWAKGQDGKHVYHTSNHDAIEAYKGPRGVTAALSLYNSFQGEDTWIAPLFERLEKWEEKYGDWDAYRLDIVISDGVLEHATDARKADQVQDHRDGYLQTVILNFLPMEDWADFRVPNRCVQYPATPDNVAGLMRNILGDWLTGI